MAYKRWHEENRSIIQRQQVLEALDGFKTYVNKKGSGKKQELNPVIGKRCLRALQKIRAKKEQSMASSMTVTEVLSLQGEISNIIISDLMEDEEDTGRSSQPRSKNGVSRETPMSRESSPMSSSDGDSSVSVDSDDSDNDEIKSAMMDAMLGGAKNSNNTENAFKALGSMTGNLMGSMLNPMMSGIMNIAKPQINNYKLKLDELRKDPAKSAEKRVPYENAYQYYSEVLDVYKSDIGAMEQGTRVEAIGKKYNKAEIEALLTQDEELKKIAKTKLNTENLQSNSNMDESIEQLGALKDQCSIS